MNQVAENSRDHLAEIRDMVSACMQCGTCSASCPNSDDMDYLPRQMWRLAQLGLENEIVNSRTFWLCSSCYSCTLRCPRGLPLTSAMATLKRLAAEYADKAGRRHGTFYREFVRNVRKYGRVQEAGLMMRYFMVMRDPLLPVGFTGIGLKLMGKGKMHPPSSRQKGRLESLFQKVEQMEAQS